MPNKDHRDQSRYEVTAYAEFSGQRRKVQSHRVTNISLGGICIETEELEPVGAEVELVLNFPDQDVSIDLRGQVVWSNPTPPMDMGIRFLDLDRRTKKLLKANITTVGFFSTIRQLADSMH